MAIKLAWGLKNRAMGRSGISCQRRASGARCRGNAANALQRHCMPVLLAVAKLVGREMAMCCSSMVLLYCACCLLPIPACRPACPRPVQANMGHDTNTAHFSIMMGPAPHLNGDYTIFGERWAGLGAVRVAANDVARACSNCRWAAAAPVPPLQFC